MSGTSSDERLVYMANQIATNFATRGPEAAALATADHLASFWDPRMKARIMAMLDRGAALSPAAADAVRSLARHGGPAPQTPATDFNRVDEAGHSDAG